VLAEFDQRKLADHDRDQGQEEQTGRGRNPRTLASGVTASTAPMVIASAPVAVGEDDGIVAQPAVSDGAFWIDLPSSIRSAGSLRRLLTVTVPGMNSWCSWNWSRTGRARPVHRVHWGRSVVHRCS
jgi:hypothetical protein